MTERDEVGAALAAAMRRDAPHRVTSAGLARALEHGVTPEDPEPLRAFVGTLEREPRGRWTRRTCSSGAPRCTGGWDRPATTCCSPSP